jgi:Zn-finger nucleic acid-binding protein
LNTFVADRGNPGVIKRKPSEAEEEFFAREEAEKKRRLMVAKTRDMADADREKLKALHHMRCPKCGMQLSELSLHGVQVERCFGCHGIFLDESDIQRLIVQEGYWSRMLNFFARQDYEDTKT